MSGKVRGSLLVPDGGKARASFSRKSEMHWRSTTWGIALQKDEHERSEHDVSTLFDWVQSMEVGFFKKIGPAVVRQLCRYLTIEEFQSGEVVFRQGDVGDRFYITVHGAVGIYIKSEEDGKKGKGHRGAGEEQDRDKEEDHKHAAEQGQHLHQEYGVQVALLPKGAAFGELALSQNIVRTATVIAAKHSMLLWVDKECYNKSLKAHHEAKVQRKVAWLKNHFLFSRWSQRTLVSFSYAMVKKEFPRKAVIFSRGEPTTSMYFILSGECLVSMTVPLGTKGVDGGDDGGRDRLRRNPRSPGMSSFGGLSGKNDGSVERGRRRRNMPGSQDCFTVDLGMLGAGEWFGESEIIRRRPKRDITVTARTPTTLYFVKRTHFRSFFRGNLLRQLKSIMVNRASVHQRRIDDVMRLRSHGAPALSSRHAEDERDLRSPGRSPSKHRNSGAKNRRATHEAHAAWSGMGAVTRVTVHRVGGEKDKTRGQRPRKGKDHFLPQLPRSRSPSPSHGLTHETDRLSQHKDAPRASKEDMKFVHPLSPAKFASPNKLSGSHLSPLGTVHPHSRSRSQPSSPGRGRSSPRRLSPRRQLPAGLSSPRRGTHNPRTMQVSNQQHGRARSLGARTTVAQAGSWAQEQVLAASGRDDQTSHLIRQLATTVSSDPAEHSPRVRSNRVGQGGVGFAGQDPADGSELKHYRVTFD